jgi:Flp pilus assembly protein TadG
VRSHLPLPRHTRRPAAGSALVEGAFVLLALIVLLTGILDIGQIFMFHQGLTERVRAGARYAATHTYNIQQIKNVVLYNASTAPAGSPKGLYGLQASQVSVTRYDSGDAVKDRIEVKIQGFPMAFYSPLLKRAYTHRPFVAIRRVESLGATN